MRSMYHVNQVILQLTFVAVFLNKIVPVVPYNGIWIYVISIYLTILELFCQIH